MLRVSNVKVYGLKESLIASGYAMRTEALTEEDYNSEVQFEKGIKRMKRLVNTSANTDVHCHDNALVGCIVQFDVTYPQFWTPEAQRYHFLDIVTSMSKMHKLLKLDLEECCNEFVTQEQIALTNSYIEEYNMMFETGDYPSWYIDRRGNRYKCKSLDDALHLQWRKILSNTPLGLELTERCTTNYKQLQTIFHQRRYHKLEDWHVFCDMIRSLPYAKEFITLEG